MITVLQIMLILLIMALLGIILGYLLGKIGCKRKESGSYIEKSAVCERKAKEITKEQNDLLEKEAKEINDNLEQASTPVALLDEKKQNGSSSLDSMISKNEDKKKDYSDNKIIDNMEEDKTSSIEETTEQDLSQNQSLVDNLETNNNESLIQPQGLLSNTAKENKEDNNIEEQTKDAQNSNKVQTNIITPLPEEKNINNKNNTALSVQTEQSKTELLKNRLHGLSAPNNNKADNLCEIKGIGKVIEAKLHSLGIYHFYQIAEWTETEIALVDNYLAFKGRIHREQWIKQAKLLAQGEETEFSKRVKKGEVPTSPKK
jgi:predicted flap endonuclease-1-like 5' DNA nuclease